MGCELSWRESNFEVLDEAADGREAVEMAYRLRPDIILMDLYLPVVKSITADIHS
jgi:YesN/AraC family two-component response regulator